MIVAPRPDVNLRTRQILMLLDQLADVPARIGVEIGVLRGDTSRGLLTNCPDLTLLMVDPWAEVDRESDYFRSGDSAARQTAEQHADNYRHAQAAVAQFGERAVIYRLPSVEAATIVTDIGFGFVFIDGDHSESGVAADLEAWVPLVNHWPRGVVCGHDYLCEIDGRRLGRQSVKDVVDRWAEAHDQQVHVGLHSVWWFTPR